MKKILLGVAALTSIATLADTQYPDFHGYLNSETSANVNNELENNKFKNEGKPNEAKASQKLTFGTFLHKDAQLHVFAGLKGDYVKFNAKDKTDNNSGVTGVDVPNYYFGARWDAPIVDDFNIALTFGHKHGYGDTKKVYGDYKQNGIKADKEVKIEDETVLEDVVVKHLKAKNKLNQAKIDSKDDKEGYLKDNGYKLAAKDNTELLSAVLSGKIDDNFDLTVAGLYNSTEFNDGTHELESYAKTSGKLTDNVKVSGEVNHLIKSETYDVAGRLKGEVKLESQLNKNTLLTNALKGELKNILGNKHDGEFVSENGLKYTGFSNTVVEQGLNYKLKADGKTAVADDAVKYEHTPEYKLDLSYTGENVRFTTKNSEKVEVKLAKKDSAVKELNNIFKTYNNIKYVNGGFELGLDANYDLKTNLLAKPHSNEMKFLTGPTIKYTYNDEDVLTVTTDNSAKYLLTALANTGEKADLLGHEGFAFTKNKAVISELFGVDTEVKLNAHNYVISGDAVSTKTNKDFVSFTDMLLANAGVKFTKAFNDTTKASLEVNGNYFLKATNTNIYKDSATKEIIIEKSDKILLDHFGSADATLNVTSTLSENADRKVDLITEVKGEYKYMKLGSKYIEGFAKFVEAAGYTDGEYRVLDGYVAKEFNNKDQADFITQGFDMFDKSKNTEHSLAVKPSVAVKFDITKNLTVTPKLGANFEFAQKLADNSKFELNKVTGEGSLNISYTW